MDKHNTNPAKFHICKELNGIAIVLLSQVSRERGRQQIVLYQGVLKEEWRNRLVDELKIESEGYFVQAITPLGYHVAIARIDIESLYHLKETLIDFLLNSMFNALISETEHGAVFKYNNDSVNDVNDIEISLHYHPQFGAIDIGMRVYGQMVKSLL